MQRIVGGSVTTIEKWPFAAALLYSPNFLLYSQSCGGTIITNRDILSAMHCFINDNTLNWRARVGSTNAHSGGVIHKFGVFLVHQDFNRSTNDNDIIVLRTVNNIVYNQYTQPARIAGLGYVLEDQQAVWAIGWGSISVNGPLSEQLREVQIWSINQSICKNRYAEIGLTITDNMLCSGHLDVGGRDQCQGDSGGPLIHNNIVVGVCSWGYQCALPRYPGVNTRVSNYNTWIRSAVAYSQ